MKKYLNLLMLIIISIVLGISNVKAKSSCICDKTVNEHSSFKCDIIIDTEPILIVSDNNIKISNIDATNYLKKSNNEVLFYSNGTIKYDLNTYNINNLYISIYDETKTNKYDNDITVNVIKNSETTSTTRVKSSNNYLKSIIVNDEVLKKFSKNETRYYITYNYDVSNVDIKYKLEDNNATVEINGPKTLEVGDNEYTIGVTSEDGTIRYYKLLITRKDKEKELSSNTYLKELSINKYPINFKKQVKTYHINIDNKTNKLNIKIQTEDINATYEVLGNENLKNGSIINIKVTAEDKSTDSYRLIIDKKNRINILYILVPSILLIILIIIFILYSKFHKKKTNKNENIETDLEVTKKVFELNDTKKEEVTYEDNSIDSIVNNIQNSIDDNSYEKNIDVYLDELDEFDNKCDVVKALFRLIENNPLYDFKMPGSLSNYIESFDTIYEEYLVKSIENKPTILSIWMLNRCIAANENKNKYEAIIENIVNSKDIDSKLKKFINEIKNKES